MAQGDIVKPEASPKTVYLKDYRPPSHLVDAVALRFDLREDRAVVSSEILARPNDDPRAASGPLALDGENIRLVSISIDGRALEAGEYAIAESRLIVKNVPARPFTLTIQTECEPQKNLAFEGLYKSSGMFCTQCEAEGFRRITYYLDRPDVMAKFRVTIEADEATYPVLLSNGNLVAKRSLGDGRHEATWEDPFKKPAYLFAMVAGNLAKIEDEFVRRSGKPVKLEIFCEKGMEDRCWHAMDSLKRAMKWDEDAFGREYDLDVFMIVVANDFNMGAMENKGLNVFNSRYVLARPETATDADYDGILAVVGHEYFHNWTGNRITCRDWFQLSLKEGLTVFRDQQFSGDMGSAAVNRIEDVMRLRTAQFPEDAGPMAHAIRPRSYITINNFYTATIYEKGAEVIRMLRTLLGPADFRRGMDRYFESFDGQAVTTEDFVGAMEAASGRDFSLFKRWYDQAGTPTVRARLERLADGRARVTFAQAIPPTPGQPTKEPALIPIAMGFVGPDGRDVPFRIDAGKAPQPTNVVELHGAEQTFEFDGDGASLTEAVPSFLRGFSAPVKFEFDYADSDLAFLMARDSDPFARWEASQELALRELKRLAASAHDRRARPEIIEAFASAIQDRELDPAFAALLLYPPSDQYLAQHFAVVDPDAICAARDAFRLALAQRARASFESVYANLSTARGRDAAAVGARALKNRALEYLCLLDDVRWRVAALEQMRSATCMTDELGALAALSRSATAERETALEEFYAKWKREPLVVDKWLSIQATAPTADALERVRKLAASPAFDRNNPNKIFYLFGHFSNANLRRFHERDGSGYRFLADQILEIESRNPQVAARLMGAFNQWRRFDPHRQILLKREIARILAKPGLSPDIYEIASKALA